MKFSSRKRSQESQRTNHSFLILSRDIILQFVTLTNMPWKNYFLWGSSTIKMPDCKSGSRSSIVFLTTTEIDEMLQLVRFFIILNTCLYAEQNNPGWSHRNNLKALFLRIKNFLALLSAFPENVKNASSYQCWSVRILSASAQLSIEFLSSEKIGFLLWTGLS